MMRLLVTPALHHSSRDVHICTEDVENLINGTYTVPKAMDDFIVNNEM
jgi:hypothetical protein